MRHRGSCGLWWPRVGADSVSFSSERPPKHSFCSGPRDNNGGTILIKSRGLVDWRLPTFAVEKVISRRERCAIRDKQFYTVSQTFSAWRNTTSCAAYQPALARYGGCPCQSHNDPQVLEKPEFLPIFSLNTLRTRQRLFTFEPAIKALPPAKPYG